MRVTNSSTNRKFSTSINDVHHRLNKSMNKITSGRAYETAAENPTAYFQGKKIDSQYQDVLSKLSLTSNVKSRLYEQELGARDIQKLVSGAKTKVQEARTATSSQDSTLDTLRKDLLQKQQAIVNDLNGQFQNFYVYGGNDLSTTPFALSEDGKTLTFNHTFPGESQATTITMELQKDGTDHVNSYKYNVTAITNPPTGVTGSTLNDTGNELLRRAMSEQGRVDIGYGSVLTQATLLDTYTGGFNVLTGISSDTIIADTTKTINVLDEINTSGLTLVGSAAMAIEDYINLPDANKSAGYEQLNSVLGYTIDAMTEAEHKISNSYADLGNKYALTTEMEDKLTLSKLNLTEQYKEVLGVEPEEAITEMYSYNQSYNAALQIGAQLFGVSLFDFMR